MSLITQNNLILLSRAGSAIDLFDRKLVKVSCFIQIYSNSLVGHYNKLIPIKSNREVN